MAHPSSAITHFETPPLTAELVDRLVYAASRAPSAHNAQPWLVDVDGATFSIRRDREHQVLRELDPHGYESDLACGAAAANLCAAAEGLGLTADVSWRPEPDVVARINVSPGKAPEPARLAVIRDRATNRSPYRPEPLDDSVLAGLQAIARSHGFGLAIVTSRAGIREIADHATRAGARKLSHAPTQKELHAFTRFNPAAAARSRDGLDLSLFFVSRGEARAASLLMRPEVLVRLRAASRLARRSEGDAIRSAPSVCLLYAEHLDDRTYPRGGFCFEQVAFDVTQRKLALALHSAQVEIGLAHVPGAPEHAPLLAAFGLSSDAVPIVFFRLGVPTREPERRSLRRRVDATADQQDLRRVRVLFAGCGSVGGAPIEPLVRMGLERLVLADPGAYEVSDLNRQAASLADVGRNKAEVLAERARAINPALHALVEPAGVTQENVDWLVGTTDVVVDGIAVADGMTKRLLHDEAWRQRRVVITGLDRDGMHVRIYDYRNERTKPLARAPRGAVTSLPAPTTTHFGGVAAWVVLDLAAGRTPRRRSLERLLERAHVRGRR